MLIVGLASTRLEEAERAWLGAPQVSGVILFARNFSDIPQLQALVGELREARGDEFLICVDQEGGPVQRFDGGGLTRLPALARIGELYARDAAMAVDMAERHARQMASEMRALGIDLSFAPVVDLGRGNPAIGERALHAEPEVVADLATAYVRGMHLGGMAATLKHFPGHGSVLADTHVDDAEDPRSLADIRASDLVPFAACIEAGVEAVMMAHVAYPAVDPRPAGQSTRWIREILRGELGFAGVVVSDDISMAAALATGSPRERVLAHLAAGCDVVLACQPATAAAVVAECADIEPCPAEFLAPLRGLVAPAWNDLLADPQHGASAAALAQLLGDDTGARA